MGIEMPPSGRTSRSRLRFASSRTEMDSTSPGCTRYPCAKAAGASNKATKTKKIRFMKPYLVRSDAYLSPIWAKRKEFAKALQKIGVDLRFCCHSRREIAQFWLVCSVIDGPLLRLLWRQRHRRRGNPLQILGIKRALGLGQPRSRHPQQPVLGPCDRHIG